jgi:phosphoribosylanthranilate isomerase
MTHIKICGIKEEAHALAIAEAGVDYIGLVFARSPRQITPARAKKIVAALKESGAKTEVVGVFVNTPTEKINHIADSCQLDRIQLNGDEPWELCRNLNRPVIKVIRVSPNYRTEQIYADMSYGARILDPQECRFLLDSNAPDKYGGTGKTFDWNLARMIAEKFPVIIAGGLTPKNVAEAIRIISPWGVDVSSGVETKGAKDTEKIMEFIKAVREDDGN